MERDETIKVLEELAEQCTQVANIFCTQDSEKRCEALDVAIQMLSASADGGLISKSGAIKSITDGIMKHTTMRELRENPLTAISEGVAKAVMLLPSVDAVEVVRCKDCKHWKCNPNTKNYGVCRKVSYDDFEVVMEKDDFCSYGKRSEDGE